MTGHNHVHAPRGRNYAGPWRKTPGRVLGTSLVRVCSEYTYEAVARHGLWPGGWMGLFRVMRCGPGGTHGIDNVPETLDARYAWYLPWRYWTISRASRGH